MKVMFIGKLKYYNGHEPAYGEEVNVSQCPVYPTNYDVAEYPVNADGNAQSFLKTHFIPLSSIDETTFERNYQKEQI